MSPPIVEPSRLLAGACATCFSALAGCARYGTSKGLAGPAAYGGAASSRAALRRRLAFSAAGAGASGVLASTAEIPVGGGNVLTAQRS